MTLAQVVDGVTDLDSALFNPIIDAVNGVDGSLLGNMRAGLANVLDYGAVGDGTTDDTDAIQDAIDDAGATKRVYIPAGTYRTDGLQVQSYAHIFGDGVGLTTLKFIDNADYANKAHLIRSKNYLTERTDHVQIHDMTLDGNTGGQHSGGIMPTLSASLHGIAVLQGWYWRVQNVLLQNFHGDGFYIGVTSNTETYGSNHNVFANVVSTGNIRNGGMISRGQYNVFQNCRFIGNQSYRGSATVNYGTGTADSGTTTQMTDTSASFATNLSANNRIYFVTGSNAGLRRSLTGTNTSTVLNFSAFPNAVQAGDEYRVDADNVYLSAEFDLEPNYSTHSSGDNSFLNCYFESTYSTGVQVTRPSAHNERNRFHSCTFKNCRSYAMYVNTPYATGLVVDDCLMLAEDPTVQEKLFRVARPSYVQFTNNFLSGKTLLSPIGSFDDGAAGAGDTPYGIRFEGNVIDFQGASGYSDIEFRYCGGSIIRNNQFVNGSFSDSSAVSASVPFNPGTKPTVTGSRGSNAALASLCTALAGLGLITDSTS